MRVLVTGANGFIGSALINRMVTDVRFDVRGAARHVNGRLWVGADIARCPDLLPDADWTRLLANVDTIVHTAARVHIMHDAAADPLAEFRVVNVAGTLNMARQAAAAGVSRLVYMSSVKVNGEMTYRGKPFRADDVPAPLDPYGVSKMEAECGLREVARETGMEVVIIRPPLVYGAGAKGNFQAMMNWLHRGVPLPLGAIDNRRSLVALDNLVDLTITCVDHPAAANRIFMVSDCEDISTSELLRRAAHAMGKSARLFPIPSALLCFVGRLVGRGPAVERLCGSLQVDTSMTRDVLGWKPPVSLEEGLHRAVREVTA